MGDVYCSSDCQEKDWMRHKVVCSKNRKNDRRCIDCKTTESPRNPLAWCFSCRASGNLFCNLECHQRDWERQESNAGKSYDEVHKRFTENIRGGTKERDYIFRMLTSKDLTGEGGDYRPTFKTGLIHTLSKEDAHCFLVDTFRFGASGSEPFLIGGTSMTSFGKFLDKVELFGLLPAWWSPDEGRKCEEEARSRDDRATLDPFTSHELRKVMELDGLMEGLGIDSDQDDSEADSVD
ncbi:hypothetical protein EG328_007407 [Venturia inaequalis]|uniref:MYND-type domain-containing protein n=1 Tax=Venturia inaequalis TaxID=5025 RepID=A0A8H3VKW4_VENIN|nr:hypothetical protein EG328_007407 [Venturia inaequalis]